MRTALFEAALVSQHHQLAIDLRLNRDGGERRDSSEACYRLINFGRFDLCGANRLDILLRVLLWGAMRPKIPPSAKSNYRCYEQDDKRCEKSPLRTLRGLRLLDARKDGLLNLGFGGRKHLPSFARLLA
jgi:hypothetical protein